MDENLSRLIDELCTRESLSGTEFLRLQHRFRRAGAQPFYTKSEILAALDSAESFGKLYHERQKQIRAWLQVKPIRTLSGVATVTILTKPWPCPGGCIFCPADVRMPKSYLANEPGAQRAEANYFDPYLQVTNRLESLQEMGHPLDKVEIIILGGTWDAYQQPYQIWYVDEVFRALNEFGRHRERVKTRMALYEQLDHELASREAVLSNQAQINQKRFAQAQAQVTSGTVSYNQYVQENFLRSERERRLSSWQQSNWAKLAARQRENSKAQHRCVGLVIETRPDCITIESARTYRQLGATKVQIGVQSVNEEILRRNGRAITPAQIARAVAILRLYGFKIHAHFMANLLGATPEADIADFKNFVTDPQFLPDEIKLYPCSLIRSSELYEYFTRGEWMPYTHAQLLQVLTAEMKLVPEYVRISRMIRDFSANDIESGNKRTNFRQLVDDELARQGVKVREIRSREIRGGQVSADDLHLVEYQYETSVSREYFLQFVTADEKLVGFLRLSLPEREKIERLFGKIPDEFGDFPANAMIREVHVYGAAAKLRGQSRSQHQGLGKKLISRAQAIAKADGRKCVRVISAVGTREYYAAQGFSEDELYQKYDLVGCEE